LKISSPMDKVYNIEYIMTRNKEAAASLCRNDCRYDVPREIARREGPRPIPRTLRHLFPTHYRRLTTDVGDGDVLFREPARHCPSPPIRRTPYGLIGERRRDGLYEDLTAL